VLYSTVQDCIVLLVEQVPARHFTLYLQGKRYKVRVRYKVQGTRYRVQQRYLGLPSLFLGGIAVPAGLHRRRKDSVLKKVRGLFIFYVSIFLASFLFWAVPADVRCVKGSVLEKGGSLSHPTLSSLSLLLPLFSFWSIPVGLRRMRRIQSWRKCGACSPTSRLSLSPPNTCALTGSPTHLSALPSNLAVSGHFFCILHSAECRIRHSVQGPSQLVRLSLGAPPLAPKS